MQNQIVRKLYTVYLRIKLEGRNIDIFQVENSIYCMTYGTLLMAQLTACRCCYRVCTAVELKTTLSNAQQD